MKIDIVIPTRNRSKRLDFLLHSIKDALIPDMKVWIFFDNRVELNNFRTEYNWFDSWVEMRILMREFAPATFWNDFLLLMDADVGIYLSDHCTMDKNCLKELKKVFEEKFPDYDGVVGMRISDLPSQVEAAFSGFGRKFADRFPNRQVWCRDYKAFYVDEELGIFAKSIGKFHFSETATVTYNFPFLRMQLDATSKWTRRNKQRDIVVNKERKNRGLLWGRDFTLIRGN